MTSRKVVDLFCGIGGMSLGFQNAGFEIVAAFDKWKPALAIYQDNFSHMALEKDLFDPAAGTMIKELAPDIIIGGPPCQDFSIAGKREQGERANLTLRFSELVSEARPGWFVMENVYNIERMPVLEKAKTVLKNAGYGLTTTVLDASRCGVPQARKRFFMIGKLGEKHAFLERQLTESLADTQMTVRDYLGNSLGTEFYYMHPRSYARRAVFSIDEPASTIRGVNRPIPQNYQAHKADKAPISAGVRALTTKERSLLQTFPPEFILNGSKTNQEQAIGNAVPVRLAEFVATQIRKYEELNES